MSQIKVKLIEDSIANNDLGERLTTLQLTYHRYIHGEFMTHRVFSRNASSSRAIPVMTTIKQVWSDPAMPVHWGANMPGMQAKEQLTGWRAKLARGLWRFGAKVACCVAYGMVKVGLHKQVANRILEPWQLIHVIVSATEWSNFLHLRRHEDAQPEIRVLAVMIGEVLAASKPKVLLHGQWHLPYVSEKERQTLPPQTLKAISAARCARVSYLTHDGQNPSVVKDGFLYSRLVGSSPIHASPVEHQATPVPVGHWARPLGNFNGWGQHRAEVETGALLWPSR